MRPITIIKNALRQTFATRFRIALTLVTFCCVASLLCKQYQTKRLPAPRAPLAQRAFAMCREITGACDAVSAPRLYDASVALPGELKGNRRLWSVICQSGGQRLNLLFNEKTGRICCAFGETHYSNEKGRKGAGIATPEQAVHVARLRLKQLEMLAPDVSYTLAARPELQREKTAWQIQWTVRHPDDPVGRQLKIVLDRDGGFPLSISDLYELRQFASRYGK